MAKEIICMGIESTAHTFGIGIVTSKKRVLANVKDSYTTSSGGIIPAAAADHHVECFDQVIREALDKAKLKLEDIDIISFSQAPGIGHTLRVGSLVARMLSLFSNKPLIGVNHCIAHLEIGRMLTKAKDPVLLYVSGANTQIIAYEGGKYRIFGETLDGGLGNFLDTFAREMGLGFPGGPKIGMLASKGKNYIELPYVVKGMDASFGGILTNVKQKYKSGKYSKEDLCFSLQETVFSMMVEASERAIAHTGKKELLLGGGVACNKRLQEMCQIMCLERGAKCYILPNEFNVDNGAMIAWLGIVMHEAGIKIKVTQADIDPYERTDDVSVSWRETEA
jgi:N6-L-threonylcarbamoyladenine synthase